MDLFIVVAIIAVLVAIAIPQLASYRQRAVKASMQADAGNVATMEEVFFDDTYSYIATTSNSGGSFVIGTQTGLMSYGNILQVLVSVPPTIYLIIISNETGGTGSTSYTLWNNGVMGFY